MPSGSSPLAGSSRISTCGSPSMRGGDAEPLLHAQRVALELALRGRGQPDQLQHLVGARPAAARPRRRSSAGGCGRCGPCARCDASSTAPTCRSGSVQVGVAAAADGGACRRSGVTRLSSIRRVVVLPAPFGPRKPVTRPGATVNDRSSTARTLLVLLGQAGHHDLTGRWWGFAARQTSFSSRAWRSRYAVAQRGARGADGAIRTGIDVRILPGEDPSCRGRTATATVNLRCTGRQCGRPAPAGPTSARTGHRRGSLSHFSDTPQDATSLGADDGSHGRSPDRGAAARRRGRPEHPRAALGQPALRRVRRHDRDQRRRRAVDRRPASTAPTWSCST